MRNRWTVLVPVVALAAGCAAHRAEPAPGPPRVTVPNGSTPAAAPRAPINDDLRTAGWNHGNGILWVSLNPGQFVVPEDQVREDGSIEIKFGWWRGIRGRFWISGRRLDASAPPLRYSLPAVESYGDLGFVPSSLIFPSKGYWEITGHIDGQNLTFVVRVTSSNPSAHLHP